MDYTKTIQGLALPKSVPDTSPYRSNSGEPLVQGGGRRSPLPKTWPLQLYSLELVEINCSELLRIRVRDVWEVTSQLK